MRIFCALFMAFSMLYAQNPAKGSNPSLEDMQRFMHQPNFEWNAQKQKGYFKNLNPQMPHIERASMWAVAKYYLFKPKNATPNKPLPFVEGNFHTLHSQSPAVVWFGHSSLLINYKDFTMLIDPVFSDYASPKSFINRAFKADIHWSAKDFNTINALVITHDHYDHLDYPTINALKAQVERFIVPLGVGSHLRFWGIESSKITELNWWESVSLAPDIRLHATPAQHSSGRGLEWDRTLWSSYLLEIGGKKIFLSGDGGYYTHFKDIGNAFGGVDLAILENGQYNIAWKYSHSFTPQVLQAALDLRAKMVMPIHYGRFVAGSHAWNEPLKNLIKLCDLYQLPISVPRLGEVYELDSAPKRDIWWEF